MFDWGDNTTSGWLGPFTSGATATAQKSWAVKGTYAVKVKAKDVYGAESNWSDPLAVTMPLSQLLQNPFVETILQWFSHLMTVLKVLVSRFGFT